MKFLILASCLVLSVVAMPQHETVGLVKHLNGAVVPQDTTSVLAAKQLHANAHVTAAVHGFKHPYVYGFPYVPVPAAKVDVEKPVEQPQVVQYAGLPFTYGLHHPYTYGLHHPYTLGLHTAHHLGKREAEAEADPALLYSTTHPYTYGTYPYTHATYPYTYALPQTPKKTEDVKAPVVTYPYGLHHPVTYGLHHPYTYALPKVVAKTEDVKTPVVTYPYGLHHPVTYGLHHPYTAVHHLGKREAEADPAWGYSTYSTHPYTYGTYPYTYTTGTYNYPYTTPVTYNYPYNYGHFAYGK